MFFLLFCCSSFIYGRAIAEFSHSLIFQMKILAQKNSNYRNYIIYDFRPVSKVISFFSCVCACAVVCIPVKREMRLKFCIWVNNKLYKKRELWNFRFVSVDQFVVFITFFFWCLSFSLSSPSLEWILYSFHLFRLFLLSIPLGSETLWQHLCRKCSIEHRNMRT